MFGDCSKFTVLLKQKMCVSERECCLLVLDCCLLVFIGTRLVLDWYSMVRVFNIKTAKWGLRRSAAFEGLWLSLFTISFYYLFLLSLFTISFFYVWGLQQVYSEAPASGWRQDVSNIRSLWPLFGPSVRSLLTRLHTSLSHFGLFVILWHGCTAARSVRVCVCRHEKEIEFLAWILGSMEGAGKHGLAALLSVDYWVCACWASRSLWGWEQTKTAGRGREATGLVDAQQRNEQIRPA